MEKECSFLLLEENLLFKVFGFSNVPLSSTSLTSVSQAFLSLCFCGSLLVKTKISEKFHWWGCAVGLCFEWWWDITFLKSRKGKGNILCFRWWQIRDMPDFHVLCLQGGQKSLAVKRFIGPALKCIRGFCTHGCKQWPPKLSYQCSVFCGWWQHVFRSVCIFLKKNVLSLSEFSVSSGRYDCMCLNCFWEIL